MHICALILMSESFFFFADWPNDIEKLEMKETEMKKIKKFNIFFRFSID